MTQPPRPAQDHRIVWIDGGSGIFQVDFRDYHLAGRRVFFLSPGQYFHIVAGSYSIREVAIPADVLDRNPQVETVCRVLFTPVYEAGAIDPADGKLDLPEATGPDRMTSWLVEAASRWSDQKPLHPEITEAETDLIFDLRQIIESAFREARPVSDYARRLGLTSRTVNRVTRTRINRTIGDLVQWRRLLEAKRELVFTAKTVQEIGYELDFTDPAYFNRFFSHAAGMAPGAFRDAQSSWSGSPFLDELSELIEASFRTDRSVASLAGRMNLTPKALSAKVKKLTGRPVGDLIRDRVTAEARHLLESSDQPIQEIAWDLGFREAGHLSRFFREATGQTPSEARRSTHIVQ